MLDGIEVSEGEKVPALNLHGDDLPMRRAIYDRFLPQAEETTPESFTQVCEGKKKKRYEIGFDFGLGEKSRRSQHDVSEFCCSSSRLFF
jgi:FAD synthase